MSNILFDIWQTWDDTNRWEMSMFRAVTKKNEFHKNTWERRTCLPHSPIHARINDMEIFKIQFRFHAIFPISIKPENEIGVAALQCSRGESERNEYRIAQERWGERERETRSGTLQAPEYAQCTFFSMLSIFASSSSSSPRFSTILISIVLTDRREKVIISRIKITSTFFFEATETSTTTEKKNKKKKKRNKNTLLYTYIQHRYEI